MEVLLSLWIQERTCHSAVGAQEPPASVQHLQDPPPLVGQGHALSGQVRALPGRPLARD